MICDKWLHVYGNKLGTGVKCEWVDDVRENVRGEWIEDKKAERQHQLIFHKVWTCSQCGEQQCRPKGSNFCPNCGAKMRGEA